MKAKARVIDFLKKTQGSKAPKTYEFTVQGDERKARAYTQCMRVELSRMRALVADLGKQRRMFKMRCIEIRSITETETVVKLLFQESYTVRVQQEIAQVFGALSIGSVAPESEATAINETRSDGVVLPQRQSLSALLRRSVATNE